MRAAAALAMTIILIYGGSAFSDELNNANRIKAAYIYNLLKFTTWPDNKNIESSSTLNICLAGQPNEVAQTLASAISGRSVSSKSLRAIYIPAFSNTPDETTMAKLQDCQAIYIGVVSPDQSNYLVNYSIEHSLLSISDNVEFTHQKGMVQLTTTSQIKVSIIINMISATQANINFSSKLLSLAELIKEE